MASKKDLKAENSRLRIANGELVRTNTALAKELSQLKATPPPQPSLIEQAEDAVWGVIERWLPPWV